MLFVPKSHVHTKPEAKPTLATAWKYFGPGLFRAVQLCLCLGLRVVEFLPSFGLQLLVVIYHIFLCLATGLAGNTAGVLLPDGFQSRILLLGLWPVRLRHLRGGTGLLSVRHGSGLMNVGEGVEGGRSGEQVWAKGLAFEGSLYALPDGGT
ncbi:hypothetical protein B0H14DRAFT_2754895 [Mycena olivaceomarginata]|nr:hypothetical protein B0H14DRAFT_2754895 [Mycena olivaceomarginata]